MQGVSTTVRLMWQDQLASREALLRDVDSALRDLAAARGDADSARQERARLQVALSPAHEPRLALQLQA